MIALVAYGSLMDPDEIAALFGRDKPCTPVRVHGFRRSFCQEPSWRSGEGDQRGVLTVRESRAGWFNGILVGDLVCGVFESLDQRECGYHRRVLTAGSITPYRPGALRAEAWESHVYAGRKEKWREGLLPNPRYLDLCTTAAGRWGDEFLEDFLTTTFVGTKSIREFRMTPDV